jgi:hypothetical protein
MKVGEACALRWQDVDVEHSTLTARYARGTQSREVVIPEDLLPVLRVGVRRCDSRDFIFAGARQGKPLTTWAAEMILERAVRIAGIERPVTCMTLRHSCAVRALELGWSIREVQEALGHLDVETTLRYEQCRLPADAVSPLDMPLEKRVAVGESDAAVDAIDSPVFEEPLEVTDVELPFEASEDTLWSAGTFYSLLRTHLWGRFLALRHTRFRGS